MQDHTRHHLRATAAGRAGGRLRPLPDRRVRADRARDPGRAGAGSFSGFGRGSR